MLDGTLEPLLGEAMDGASFIYNYPRSQARAEAGQVQPGATSLDEKLARLVAVREGLNVVVSGAISKAGSGYAVSLKAVDPVTGNTVAQSQIKAPSKEKLLASLASLAQPIRKALGDRTPAAKQAEAAETFTASSLEAAHAYSQGQDAQFAGKYDEAAKDYQQAVNLDPDMARAYSGIGVVYRNQGDLDKAEEYLKLAMSKPGMSPREAYRTRGAMYITKGSFEKAVDEYTTLLKQFPADNVGHANVAIAYLYLRNLPRAVEEGRKAIEIYPKNVAQRNNLAAYLLYSGKFDEAAKEADEVLKLNPAFERAYVAKALGALASGNVDQASAFYEQVGKVSARGLSYRSLGLADIALFQG
ncbi:MAG: tetratricopeptide repeat protein, partial [Bryobacteraceae bacterium]